MIPKYIYTYIIINLFFIIFSLHTKFNFSIGPHENLNLYGFLINNWKKWFLIMIVVIIKNFIFDYYNKLYLNWYQYEIDEKYTKKQKNWKKSSIIELLIINIIDILEWIYSMIEYILFRNNDDELQLFIPNFISKYLISNNYFHYNLMKHKL